MLRSLQVPGYMLSSPCTPYSFRGPEEKQKSKDLDQSYCKEKKRYCIDEKNSEDAEDKGKGASNIGMIHILQGFLHVRSVRTC